MSPTSKPASVANFQREHESLLMIVGQLLEATKAASDGIKSLNAESRQNTQTMLAAAKTLEMVEDVVSDLNRVVRTGNGALSLVGQVITLRTDTDAVKEALKKCNLDNADLKARIDVLDTVRQTVLGMKTGVLLVIGVIGWLLTTALAIFGALHK